MISRHNNASSWMLIRLPDSLQQVLQVFSDPPSTLPPPPLGEVTRHEDKIRQRKGCTNRSAELLGSIGVVVRPPEVQVRDMNDDWVSVHALSSRRPDSRPYAPPRPPSDSILGPAYFTPHPISTTSDPRKNSSDVERLARPRSLASHLLTPTPGLGRCTSKPLIFGTNWNAHSQVPADKGPNSLPESCGRIFGA